MKRLLALLGFSLLMVSTLLSLPRINEDFGYRLDLASNWLIKDNENLAYISYSDISGHCILQTGVFLKENLPDIDAFFNALTENIDPWGDYDYFEYNGEESILAELSYEGESEQYKGYHLYTQTDEYYYYVSCFSPEEEYEGFLDLILSGVNSFYLEEALMKPGPVSQFYYSDTAGNDEFYEVNMNGSTVGILLDPNHIEANQVVIEREARLLASSEELVPADWQRYYRVIYRDCFARMDSVFFSLDQQLDPEDSDPIEIADFFLDFIQSFNYTRINRLSDLDSPLNSLITQTGDCDSQSLLLSMLLRHYDIESILLVSDVYTHALAGIDLTMEGAGYTWAGKKYIIAETTDDVDLGLIEQNMSDPAGWIPIDFP